MRWLVVLAVVATVKSADDDALFHCDRKTQFCEKGVCDIRTGQCSCFPPFVGFACQVNTYDYVNNHTECSRQCENGGTCMYHKGNDRTKDICLCSENYVGTLCEESRVRVSCGGSWMNVTFTPIWPYWGIAYVGDKTDDCILGGDFMATSLSQSFSLNTSCSGIVVDDEESGDVVHRYQLHIQFNKNFLTADDLMYNITCVHSARAETDVEGLQIQEGGVVLSKSKRQQDLHGVDMTEVGELLQTAAQSDQDPLDVNKQRTGQEDIVTVDVHLASGNDAVTTGTSASLLVVSFLYLAASLYM